MTALSVSALIARVDRTEVLRYMGTAAQCDDTLSTLVEEALAELEKVAVPRMVWRRVEVTTQPDGIGLGPVTAPGADLAQHLAGCREAVLFAATLGIGVDQLIRRVALLSMSQSAALQAGAAALLETYCDWCQEELAKEPGAAHQRSRFSPGYGDLPLSFQGPLLRCLESHRIGLTTTAAMMMVPTKSVSAIIGLGEEQGEKRPCGRGCAFCSKTDCAFRKVE